MIKFKRYSIFFLRKQKNSFFIIRNTLIKLVNLSLSLSLSIYIYIYIYTYIYIYIYIYIHIHIYVYNDFKIIK